MPGREKFYSKVSIDTIRYFLKVKFNNSVGRSWIYECIRKLIDAGILTRQKRCGRNPDGTYWQKSSMLSFAKAGAWYLIDRGIDKGRKILKAIEAWRESGDKRFPRFSKNPSPPYNHDDYKNQKELRALTEIVAAPI